jgi:AGZA family xanthine/uracil permease-like MFS transporter
MGLYAKFPIALASGMGENAFFTYTACLTMGISRQVAAYLAKTLFTVPFF